MSFLVCAQLATGTSGQYYAVKDGREVLKRRTSLSQWRRDEMACDAVVVRKGGASSGSGKLSRGIRPKGYARRSAGLSAERQP